jgi:ABC-type proline/glycine betaine transport system ATPase subunit
VTHDEETIEYCNRLIKAQWPHVVVVRPKVVLDASCLYLASRLLSELRGHDLWLLLTLTVEENIELPLLYSGLTPKEAKDRVHEVLTKVGLPDKCFTI